MSEKYFDICRQICVGHGYDIRDINWIDFYLFLKNHRLFLLIYDEIKSHIPPKYRPRYDTDYFMERARIDGYIALAKDITKYLYAHKVYGFVFEGGFTETLYIYANPYKRSQENIKILCDEKNAIPICNLLEEYGFCEEYLFYFNEFSPLSSYDKHMHYLDETDKVWVKNGKRVIVRTAFRGFSAHRSKKAVEERQTAMVKGFAFPVCHPHENFFRFCSSRMEHLGICAALEGDWMLSDVTHFYFYLKNHFGDVISLDYSHLDPNLYEELTIMLYFVAELFDDGLVRNFCSKTGILYEDLHYCEHISLNMKKAFWDMEYRKKRMGAHIKRKNMHACSRQASSKYVTEYLNPAMGRPWLSDVPHVQAVVMNKYFAQAGYGFCHDEDYVYFNVSLLKEMPSVCLQLMILNINETSDILQYHVSVVVENGRHFIYDSDLDRRHVKTILSAKGDHVILSVQIKRDPAYVAEEKTYSFLFFNYAIFIWKTNETVYPPLVYDRPKHHFHKILMDHYK